MANSFEADPRQPSERIISAITDRYDAENVRIVRTFSPGPQHTDALLFCVAVTRQEGGKSRMRKLIVKVVAADSARKQAAGHRRAERSDPAFAERHIVEQIDSYRMDERSHLLFQRVANGGDTVRSFEELPDAEQLEALPLIVNALLNDWNTADTGPNGSGLETVETTVGGFLRREVTAMASVTEVLAAATDLGMVERTDHDDVRPDPLHLLDCTECPLSRAPMEYFAGHTHGDLHGGNLLFPEEKGEPQFARFQLVDVGGYQADGPLTRDVLFLLLCTLLRTVAPRTPSGQPGDVLPRDQAEALLRYLINPDIQRPAKLLPGLAQLIEAVHEIGLAYVKEADCVPEWRQQWRLALVGHALVCLTFTNLGEAARRWCLRLAEEALKAYRDASPDDDQAAPAVPSPAFSPPTARTGRHAAGSLDGHTSGSRLDQQMLSIGTRPIWIHEQLLDTPLVVAGEGMREPAPSGLGVAHSVLNDRRARKPAKLPMSRMPADAFAAPQPATTPATPPQSAPPPATPEPATRPAAPRAAAPCGSVPHPDGAQHDSDGPAQQAHRWLGPRKLRTWAVAFAGTLGVLGLTGVVLGLTWVVLDRRNDIVGVPTQTIAPSPSRVLPSASDRYHGARTAPVPDNLAELAANVRALVETPLTGRYAHTCHEVKSWAMGDGRSLLVSHHRYEVWFTPERSGMRIETEFDGTTVVNTTSTFSAENAMTEMLPMPKVDPEALRDQLRREYRKLPPELRTATGKLHLIIRSYHFHPLDAEQRAVLVAELARTPGIEFVGSYEDSAGRPGIAVRAADREGRRDTLVLDAEGRLLSHELTRDDTLISEHLYLFARRTDTMDTTCN